MSMNGHILWKQAETWNQIIKDEVEHSYIQMVANNSPSAKSKKVSTEQMIEKLSEHIKVKILQMVTDYSIMLKLQSDMVIDIVTTWTKTFGLETKHLRNFIIDIRTYQQMKSEDKCYIELHLSKKKIERNRYETPIIFVIARTVGYLNKPQELLSLLLLNKQSHSLLKERVYKEVIKCANFEYSSPHRLKLWKSLLECVRNWLHNGRICIWGSILRC